MSFVPSFESKISTVDSLLSSDSCLNRPLVFTNGCFDILHRGHVTYLAQAKTLGVTLIVAVNSDDSIRRLGKGSERPINNLQDRMAVLASLASVDYVLSFDELNPLKLIKLFLPDVLVKGGDWSVDKIVGSDFVFSNGGSVISIPFLYNSSTTSIIRKISQK